MSNRVKLPNSARQHTASLRLSLARTHYNYNPSFIVCEAKSNHQRCLNIAQRAVSSSALQMYRRLMEVPCAPVLVCALSRAIILDQRLPGFKFEHGSGVSLCRESVLTRGNMNQIHAAI
jgi:hypothetical protein